MACGRDDLGHRDDVRDAAGGADVADGDEDGGVGGSEKEVGVEAGDFDDQVGLGHEAAEDGGFNFGAIRDVVFFHAKGPSLSSRIAMTIIATRISRR